jgi:hypothetical protein
MFNFINGFLFSVFEYKIELKLSLDFVGQRATITG